MQIGNAADYAIVRCKVYGLQLCGLNVPCCMSPMCQLDTVF